MKTTILQKFCKVKERGETSLQMKVKLALKNA